MRSFPAKVREAGIAYTIYRSLQLIAPRFFRLDWFTVYERPLVLAASPAERAGVRWATSDDAELLVTLGQPMSVVEGRLARGDRACMYVRGSELIAYLWCSSGAYEDVGLRFELARGEVWLHDAKVAREHRGHGHYSRLLRVALADLADEGRIRILSAVDELNRNSRRAVSGRCPLSRFFVLRIRGLHIVRARRGPEVRWLWFTGSSDVPHELYAPSAAA